MIKELYIIGFAQSVFFALLILTKKNRDPKDYFLLFFILIMGFNLLFLYANKTNFYTENPLLILFDFAYWTLIGPSLYLYIHYTISRDKKIKGIHLFHLIPAIIVYISFSNYIINIDYYVNAEFKFKWFNNIGYLVWMYNSPVYYFLAILRIRKHRENIKSYYSYKKSIDLKWLYYLTNGFAVFLVFLLGQGLLKKYTDIEFPFNIGSFTWLILIIYIFGIGFFGYKQKGIFSVIDNPLMRKESNDIPLFNKYTAGISTTVDINESGKSQYKKSGLNPDESKELVRQLTHYMSENKPFLSWDLNLKTLADSLNTTTHKLSQAINENLGQSFYEFINKYRVEEVKRLLSSPDKSAYNIVSLAYDAGFNTKSAFYSVFKKYTNKTPTEYRNQYLQNAS